MDLDPSFKNLVLSYGTKVETFQRLLLNITNQLVTAPKERVSVERHKVLSEAVNVLLNATEDACELAEEYLSHLQPSIQWTAGGQLGSPLEMIWETGITPMAFWLRHTHQESQIKELIQNIKRKWAGDELVEETSPKEGSYIIISSKRKTYRGYVVSASPKLRVLNVDDGRERDEELSSCYKLTTEFTALPANAIHCTLGKGYLEDAWKMDYSEDLVRIFRECRLSVEILEELPSRPPPTFLVQLHAFNEETEIELDLRDWLRDEFQIVLPDQRSRAPRSDSSKRDDSTSSELINKLKVEPTGITNGFTTNNPGEFHSHLDPLRHVMSQEMSKPHSTSTNLLPNSLLALQKRNRVLRLTETIIDSNTYAKQDSNLTPPKPIFSFESVLNAPEYVPLEKNQDLSVSNLALSSSLLTGQVSPVPFLPEDDDKICAVWARDGRCHKIGCRKVHPPLASLNKLAVLGEEIYNDTFSGLRLPGVGAELDVLVTHVASAHCFYAQLPPSFSGSDGNSERLEDLVQSLNSSAIQQELKLLRFPPTFGEFLIAYSSHRRKWLRAFVTDVSEDDDDSLVVIFVDYGNTEEVRLSQCRAMLPQFNHLPIQAVICSLYKVKPLESSSGPNGWKESTGKIFLESNILDKYITIRVVNCCDENSLEVEARVNGNSINDLVVEKGFCIKNSNI